MSREETPAAALDSAPDGFDPHTETLTDLIDRLQRDAFTRSRPRQVVRTDRAAEAGSDAPPSGTLEAS